MQAIETVLFLKRGSAQTEEIKTEVATLSHMKYLISKCNTIEFRKD